MPSASEAPGAFHPGDPLHLAANCSASLSSSVPPFHSPRNFPSSLSCLSVTIVLLNTDSSHVGTTDCWKFGSTLHYLAHPPPYYSTCGQWTTRTSWKLYLRRQIRICFNRTHPRRSLRNRPRQPEPVALPDYRHSPIWAQVRQTAQHHI